MYDPVSVFTVAADSDGASNGIIAASNGVGVLVHKVVLRQTVSGSNVVSVALNDHDVIGSSATLINLTTNSTGGAAGEAWERYRAESFDPPVRFDKGVSIDVTGTSVSVTIYYTRQ